MRKAENCIATRYGTGHQIKGRIARQGIDKKRETKRKINVKQGMEQVVKEYNKARNKAQ